MKCFNHPQNEAAGTCKFCFRGICRQCVRDSGVGLACSEACESQIKSTHALVERNKKLTAFAPSTQSRSGVMLLLMAAVFIAFGMVSRILFMKAFLAVFGLVMLCGAAFSFINSRKMARAASSSSN